MNCIKNVRSQFSKTTGQIIAYYVDLYRIMSITMVNVNTSQSIAYHENLYHVDCNGECKHQSKHCLP